MSATEVAFVAGATGYTGREVVRLLAAGGARVVAHVRPDSPRLEEWRQKFQAWGAEVDTTPWEPAALTATLTRLAPARVFALLGTTAARARSEGRAALAAYEEVDYGLTALLLAAAQACGARPRFVYLSSAGVSEGARNPYLQARVRCEREIRASGLPFTLARPSFITGPDRDDDRPLERVGARVADSLLGLVGALGGAGLRERYRSTSNTELAEGLIRIAADPAFADRIAESEDLRRAPGA